MKTIHFSWRSTKWAYSIAFLALAFNILTSEFLVWYFPERPFAPDLFFSLIPHVAWLQHLSDPLLLGSLGLLIYSFSGVSAATHHRLHVQMIWTFTSVWILRGLMIPLTPLGRPFTYNEPYGILGFIGIQQHGMFPSGHTATAIIILLFGWATKYRAFYAAAFLAQVIILLASRGHYGIDIAGGILVALLAYYFVTTKLHFPLESGTEQEL